MKRIAVFCGSSFGNHNIFKNQAELLGRTLAKQNIEIVYGGASIGLMGTVANGALEEGGKVIGVLPKVLQSKEIAHNNLTDLILVENMHERKAKMNELCDGVIALPGGFGTLEELFEMLTWNQLGIHKKPIAILNIDGFYDDLLIFLKKTTNEGFLKTENYNKLIVSKEIDDLMDKINRVKNT